ncbi:MAG: hypothetical protein CMH48_07250 [Muricauda sp.]|nr:hypothetical protein [Allomuricauda sp.]MAU26291.1 hypothetical protein [Allomuricauda sp.]MBC30628.1 hypothetical protein [Allomuricauda sp.]|tara:strand:- start:229 stop:1107 length:879 start_codon:yes stop_codon:yes gene_type:complete
MNVQDFIALLQKPATILSPKQTRELEEILDEYPYFQAARALHLKGLHQLKSYKYNNALKLTAAHTADREVLFDFITSKEFLQNQIADTLVGRTANISDSEVVAEEVEPSEEIETLLPESKEAPLPQSAKDAEQILSPRLFKTSEKGTLTTSEEESGQELELGQPLPFTKDERHSFTEWLQLTSKRPIKREKGKKIEDDERKKKFELLDRFIESSPKIVPKETEVVKVNIKESVTIDQNELMTETLAKVYLEQKKFKKAIQAYKILSLKYPEKSGFFADRIQAVKRLQNENKD